MEDKKIIDKKKEIFDKELLPHINALSTFAFHLTYNEEDGRDLVQETYLKAYKAIDHYESGTNSKAWLIKILKNDYINEYRKTSQRPTKVDFEESVNFHQDNNSGLKNQSDLRQEIYDNLLGDEVTTAIN